MQRNTELLHFAENPADWEGAVNPPIYRTSLFCFESYEQFAQGANRPQPHYSYTRVSNPTTRVLEQKIALLEHTDDCVALASGMAAITSTLVALLRTGDHVLLTANSYGPVQGFCQNTLAKFGVDTDFFLPQEGADLSVKIRPNTRLIYLESPCSMSFEITDLRAVARLAKERGITTVIDNSWATPLYQNPIDLGVDIVLHTGSKYIGGHSDLVFGLAAGPESLLTRVRSQAIELGGTISPEDAYLAIRGLRTLAVRMAAHQQAGLNVARWLEQHAMVTQVMHPGLESFAGHSLAASQMSGYSGVFSFRLQPKERAAQERFVNTLLPLFHLGCSWGGFESLIIPAFGLDSSAYRVSIGLEDEQDIIDILDKGLQMYASS